MDDLTAIAVRNRSIRAIQLELEYLAEARIITADIFRQISSLLPEPAKADTSAFTLPVAAPAPLKRDNIAVVKSCIPEKQQTIKESQQETPPSYTPNDPKPPFHCQAAWDYNQPPNNKEGDLTFTEGQYILVSRKDNGLWWSGQIIDEHTGQPIGDMGLFPVNHVEVVDENPIVLEEKKPPLPVRASASKPHGKNMMMNVAHGNSNAAPAEDKGKIKLQENGTKFGKKLGNAAIFGAGATIGGKIVSGIF
ncbi:hypothetical protein L211DRAFT_842195 [Terfezia boudieri ATCC MYA-4762]|uniref:SH3 domain-containing protein n=1 Tax=Terfezia boudieri ATCC MYA-4762 TaxID=1051890 RepID=A0A3N4LH32_9PEZI|nr:hypothetical protein L211DRAFT_842195 [Terfezia boudieri ATCC MYA-4762]